MSTSRSRYSVWLCLLLLVGCGASDSESQPPDLGSLLLIVVNHDPDRSLQQLILHGDTNNYHLAKNLLQEPLPNGGGRVEFDSIGNGTYYLTVVRELVSGKGNLVALTTSERVDLRGGIREIWVFEDAFRIFEPRRNKPDSGPEPELDAGPLPDVLRPDVAPDLRPDVAPDVHPDVDIALDAEPDALADVDNADEG